MTEANVMKQIMLRAQLDGARLFRNQTGRYRLGDRWVSSGLCVGSSDLIGWTPIVVTKDLLDRQLAVFTAIEVKGPKGRERLEQGRFLNLVKTQGGITCVARSMADVDAALKAFLG